MRADDRPTRLSAGVLLLLGVLLLGGGVARAAVDGASAPAPEPPHTPPELVAQFHGAFSGQSLEAASRLFHWQGVGAADRRRITALIEADLRGRLVEVTFLPAGDPGGPVTWNLPVVGQLLAEFETEAGRRHFSLHTVGISAGAYLIALPATGD